MSTGSTTLGFGDSFAETGAACRRVLRSTGRPAWDRIGVMAAHEIFLHFLTTVKNPVVLAACLLTVLFKPNRWAIRLMTIAAALAMGVFSLALIRPSDHPLLALAIRGAAGALVAEVALVLIVPMIVLGLAAARSLLTWLRPPP
jgi:hypothetical protein